ncbi:HigA family addiction module antitoxin [Candidatus Symbiothrix dinenymphae]|uniref:HigA family addiction module antitoxin n=1 Tax=Candidatus Symbiothrix dinenymphae TaxID=467085 RepID=UPI0006C1ED02|nr:HigA family addiction module antitoxin [Candidatus Symbiothrix dinenymphae]GAP72584.1 HigA family protein [Candidatus Symbiothrix dinenymphae]
MGNLGFGFRPTHPGEVLSDEIEYRGTSKKKLAEQMGLSYSILNDILKERRPLTVDTAMLFEAAMNLPADALMRMQLKYNMQVASKDKQFSKRLAEVRKMVATLL